MVLQSTLTSVVHIIHWYSRSQWQHSHRMVLSSLQRRIRPPLSTWSDNDDDVIRSASYTVKPEIFRVPFFSNFATSANCQK